MGTTFVRRGLVAASVSGVALAVLATGCGAGRPTVIVVEEDVAAAELPTSDVGAGPARKGQQAASPQKGRVQEAPERLLVAQGDLLDHKVTPQVHDSAPASVDRPECRELAHAVSGFLPAGRTGWARAAVVAMASALPDDAPEGQKRAAALDAASSTVTVVTVGSYAGDAAHGHFTEVQTAGRACEGGYAATADGETVTVTRVVPHAASGGDEALAYTVEAERDGEPFQTELMVVRKGGTLVNFFANRHSGEAQLAAPAIEAQVRKLG
ncbi:hypothetical protein AB0F18_04320 [Streptomyces sp. NPDC029216]|uniref:hypothetical protein n=1 Tax=Streptomyces sp. NPDC029216 TaxID=3154701 RepID=UPI0033C1F95D